MILQKKDNVMRAIEQGYDMHIHPDPDYFPDRPSDDFELLHGLDEFNMAGAVIKSHQTQTGTRAFLANRYAGANAKLYGGVAFNAAVGGLNLAAFDAAIKFGCKIAWMPTWSSANEQRFRPVEKKELHGIYLLDEMGQLKHEVYEILAMAREDQTARGSGHISAKETIVLCEEARKMDVRVIATHILYDHVGVPLEEMKRLVQLGVVAEFAFSLTAEFFKAANNESGIAQSRSDLTLTKTTLDDVAEVIRYLGVEHCMLVSDAFFKGYPNGPEGIYRFSDGLMQKGFTIAEIQQMVRRTPQYLLYEA